MNDQPKTPVAMVLVEVELLADARAVISQHNTSNFTSRVLQELAKTIAKPSEQTPAVGEEFAWRRRESVLGCKPFLTAERYEKSSVLMKSYYEPFTCAQAPRLLARIAELEAQIAKANNLDHLKPDMDAQK